MTKTEQIQDVLNLKVDDRWGPATDAAVAAEKAASIARHAKPSAPVPVSNGDRVDPRSEIAIATLHRKVQPVARQLVKLAKQNDITIKITSGTRTYAEQNALFAKGNVTKARGGYSNHNFGLAFDVTIFDGPQPVWESKDYTTVGQLGKSLGLEWGGDWKSFRDEPHFQLRPGWASSVTESQMLSELRRRHDKGVDAFA